MKDIYTPQTGDLEEGQSGAAAPPPPLPAGRAALGGGLEGLPPLLAAVVRGIAEPGPRQFIRNLFADLVRLLSLTEYLRGAVENGDSLAGVPRVLDALGTSSRYLLTHIETAELRIEGISVPLSGVLEEAGFVLRHELRRIFETELPGCGTAQGTDRREVLRACALLENCFQQLTICLARAFEAGMTGTLLFESYRRRREQTLVLLAELDALLNDTGEAERVAGGHANVALLQRVRRFRYEFLHYLNYRDWEDFERFSDALELSHASEGEMPALLHRLFCYLQTLRRQVEMRTVLADS